MITCAKCGSKVGVTGPCKTCRRIARRNPAPKVGEGFKDSRGEVWTVTEVKPFGGPYWVISSDRRRQAPVQRAWLEGMERVQGITAYGAV